MKKVLVVICVLIFVNQTGAGQSLLNGSFEITTAGCTGDLSNDTFNLLMSDVRAIGNLEWIRIYDDSMGCGDAADGIHSIRLMHLGSLLLIDAISLRLTDSLQAGISYSISFYHSYFALVNPDSIEIGVSDNDSTFGTLVGISPMITTPGIWIQRIVNFTAPISGNFITVRPHYPGGGWNYLDHFTITATTSINDFQSSNSNFQIFPNPTKDFINISFTLKEEKNVSVEVYDLLGRKVFEKELPAPNSKLPTKIDMRSFSGGIYVVEINTGEGIYRKKVLKE